MGRFADIIRCHILEEYMSSYMRVRGVDAMLVLRNENKWAMTGKYSDILLYNPFFYIFSFDFRISERDFVVSFCFSC